MIDYEVRPHDGVGPVKLGMTRDEARAAMPEEPRPYQKGGEGPLVDAFHRSAFQVFYDDEDRVEYLEVSAGDAVRALLDGEPVLTQPADEVVERVAAQTPYDESDPELGYTYVFLALDLAFWRPVQPEGPDDDEGRTFSAVGVGRPGYYAR